MDVGGQHVCATVGMSTKCWGEFSSLKMAREMGCVCRICFLGVNTGLDATSTEFDGI